MKYTINEIEQYVAEEDVKFIRLAFTDVFGRKKNTSIMSDELRNAFECGVPIKSSAIRGFETRANSDLLLRPDTSTIAVLPWRPERGRVIRMFCSISYPDGTSFESDSRSVLIRAIQEAESKGVSFAISSEMEFYLFRRDENGLPTREPFDSAGYMDVSPDDKGENIRREICLSLEQMGVKPVSSHHEVGPGQNEIDFCSLDPLAAADAAVTFRFVVNTIAAAHGLFADFSPLPMANQPGNAMRLKFRIQQNNGNNNEYWRYAIGGLLKNICAMTLFFNPTANSYQRLRESNVPKKVAWSRESCEQIVRLSNDGADRKTVELGTPDSTCNPYLANALLIWSALDGIDNEVQPPLPIESGANQESERIVEERVPLSLREAAEATKSSSLINEKIPQQIANHYIALADEE